MSFLCTLKDSEYYIVLNIVKVLQAKGKPQATYVVRLQPLLWVLDGDRRCSPHVPYLKDGSLHCTPT